MATGFIAGLLVAFFGAAVGAVFGQFLRYYRRRKREFEDLIAVIEWIEQLSKDEVNETINDSDSHIWKLRDSLYETAEANRQFLNDDAKRHIRKMFGLFSKMKSESSWIATNEGRHLKMYASFALDEVSGVSIWQCARQFFTGGR